MSGGTASVSMGWGMGADGLRARYSPTTGGPNYLFEYDPQGSLVQRQTGGNTSYSALDTAMYDAYGSKLGDVDVFTGGAEPVRDAVGFQGQFGAYTDNETGLVLMGHRYYSPGTGRFLTRDPKGYGGGINLYGFTGNNPVNDSDADGLDPNDKRSVRRKVHDWFFGRTISPLAHANHGVQEIYDIDGVEEQDKLDRRIGAGMAQGMKQGTSIYAQAVGGAVGGGEGKAAEELEGGLTAAKVRFPFLKDHALRHGEGLSPADYLQDAINNVNAGRRFLVRHNRSQKLVFLKRTGFDEFQFTSTSLNRRTIFTNFKVNSEYLRNKGITLPKDF